MSESAPAYADKTDFIYLSPGNDFIRIYLSDINYGFTVRFNGLTAQIPVENGHFQIPQVLSPGRLISLEYTDDGLTISGTNLTLEDD